MTKPITEPDAEPSRPSDYDPSSGLVDGPITEPEHVDPISEPLTEPAVEPEQGVIDGMPADPPPPARPPRFASQTWELPSADDDVSLYVVVSEGTIGIRTDRGRLWFADADAALELSDVLYEARTKIDAA